MTDIVDENYGRLARRLVRAAVLPSSSAPIKEDGAEQEPGDVPSMSLARAGRSAPVAVQGQPGGQLQALRSTGRCPRTEQNGMSVYRRIPLQFIFQTLRIGLHAYLLGGGHSGALD